MFVHSTPIRSFPMIPVPMPYTSCTIRPSTRRPPEGEFYNDWWFYEWGKTQREYSYAVWDEDAELMSEEELGVYNDVIGIEIGDKVPEIILLAQRAVTDVARANKVAKNHYQRVRPFAFYGESSITPDRDEYLAQRKCCVSSRTGLPRQ